MGLRPRARALRAHGAPLLRHAAVCLPFIGRNAFLPITDDQMFSVVVSKCRMSTGNFVVSSLEVSLRITSFRRLFGLPV